jgi:16S rRNA (cytosine967-C5)-methyltransferase
MPVSPARAAAFDILLRVERDNSYASELLHSAHYAELTNVDRGLATELVMGVLRWRALLDTQIAALSSHSIEKLDLQVLTALRLGVYQLAFLERIPPRAAVNESAELVKRARKRSAVALVNAVLRKIGRKPWNPHDGIAKANNVQELAARSAHPLWLVERWSRNFDFAAARAICAYNQRIPETVIRLTDDATESQLKEEGIELAPGQLLASARRVKSGEITKTHAFREGKVAIQDEASQLVALLLGQGSNILDCCAAPGGKTRVIAERNPNSTIVAADLHPRRARLLRKLATASNVYVIAADATCLPTNAAFDRVLADVPCSGTGTLSRNPEIKWRLKREDLADLPARQLAILQSAMRQVAPGGRVLYSTCSLEPEENAEVVEKALAADSSFRALHCHDELQALLSRGELVWSNLDSLVRGSYLQTLPGVHPCDGFFAALLAKRSFL